MKRFHLKFVALIILLFSLNSAFAQEQNDSENEEAISIPKTAYLFDEYQNVSSETEAEKFQTFIEQIKNLPKSRGCIFVYRGRNDFQFDAAAKADQIRSFFFKLQS
jgi:hypothetical protein